MAKSDRIYLRIDPEQKAAIVQYSAVRAGDLSDHIREAIQRYLDGNVVHIVGRIMGDLKAFHSVEDARAYRRTLAGLPRAVVTLEIR